MKKILYIQEDFITPEQCYPFIDYAKANPSGDTFLGSITSTGHPDKNSTIDTPQDDGHAAYLGGDADFISMKEEKSDFFRVVVDKVNTICKSFDKRANLDYVGVVRWPIGTFMNPHYDNSAKDGIYDIFAAMLYLNDDFSGGHTGFKDMEMEIVPKVGKLVIFSNSQHKHHVTKVDDAERFVLSFWYHSA